MSCICYNQAGSISVFMRGAEIDRFGNLNTHWVEEKGKRTRLPGSGGAADWQNAALSS